MTVSGGVLIALGGLFFVVVGAVAKSLLTEEARAWLPYLSQRFIRSAARHLPDEDRDRYEEEWLAEVAAWSDRPLSALARAAHIRWNAREMRASLDDVRQGGLHIKRAMDVLVAWAALGAFAPMFAAIALLIKLESRGPVFVGSPRVGRDGKTFTMLRFRTFAEHPCDRNTRLTRSGRVLRRMSFHALPQIINVLRGEMSLVGPRPLSGYEERQGAVLDPQLRPGLVGPAALNARPEASYEELRRLDREYARTRSFARDIKLLALCVVAVLRRPPPS